MTIKHPILITGASGFVGSNLLRKLPEVVSPKKIHLILRQKSNTWRINDILPKVRVHIIDLRDKIKTQRLLQDIRPKTIFHLATHGAYPHQALDESEIFETNIISTFNLIQSSLKIGYNSFINTGSSAEYGVNNKVMSENDFLKPVTPYGVSKSWATLYSQYLALSKKVPIITIRLFGVYGFYEPRGRLIPNIILSLMKKQRPVILAKNFKRDFVFIEDVVEALLRATLLSDSHIINIGSGTKTTLQEVFNIIKSKIKVDINPIWSNNPGKDKDQRIANINLAKKYLGWVPKTNIDKGLSQTISWFAENISFYE